uniref:Uncharacterized protein n=1 Tax=Anser brachyrhynchus TaxID=132585 RepID=A0A8B9CFL6_9AVES
MLQSPPGATPASAPAMDKSSPCGSGAPGSSAGGKGQQPRSASAGPAAGESKPKGGDLQTPISNFWLSVDLLHCYADGPESSKVILNNYSGRGNCNQ